MKRNVSAGSSISVTQADTRRFYCIVSKDYENLTELQEQQLNKAYMLLKQHGAKAAITSVNKVMETKTRFAGFSYIIPEFSGELYEHLKSLEARIYGPLAIIQSLKKNGKIAKYSKPLLAMYCVGFNVTVTGLTVDERVRFLW
uniref:Uncharacterized protein n=1 Tax=Panagrolaimus sp. ES5 TaxID=591445 RepID=A0AC34FVQ7_9BILA